MRLFVAVAFDCTVKSQISGLFNAMSRDGVTGSFTPSDNLHLTLKFLGEVQYGGISAIKSALDSAVLSFSPFCLKSDRCGFFTSHGEKTIWLGMKGNELAALANAVDFELSKLDFEPERRAFTPHVTLARRVSCNPDFLSRIQVPDISTNTDSITLFESRRENGHLFYKPVYRAVFGLK